MLVYGSKLFTTPVLSVQTSGAIGVVSNLIVDPNSLKIIAFELSGGIVPRNGANILDASSVREYSHYGIVIDSIEELVEPDDVIKIQKTLNLGFSLFNLKVETKKGSRLGKVSDFTATSEDFTIQQLVVKRPIVKSFLDPELIVPRKEIVKVDNYKVTVKDEEKVIKKKAATEDFIPNFVNPFRKTEQDYAPAQTKTPDDKDIE